MQRRIGLRILLSLTLIVIICQWHCLVWANGANSLRVVMDDNYPPYVFRSSNGELEGILVDQWKLWEEKTGVKVQLVACDWAEALSQMQQNQFDVIDTIFPSVERRLFLDYSQPYAVIDVAIFFHRNISGIAGMESLQGFRIGVKRGDYIADVLRQRGITDLVEMDSYEAIIQAAKNQQLLVFAMDKPPALYYLYKMGLDKEFRYSPAVHTGSFHRAVRKGNAAVLDLVERGFQQISAAEYAVIEERWRGTPLLVMDWERVGWIVVAVGIVFALLLLWSVALQKSVARKTEELNQYIAALTKSEARLRGLFDNMHSGFAYYQVLLDRQGKAFDGIFLEANKAYESIYGLRSAEWTGRRLREIFPEREDDGYQNILQIVNNVLVTRTPAVFEQRSPRCDLWLRYSMYSPEPGYLAVLVENITVARQAAEMIRESVERYRAIMQQSSDAVAIIDLQQRCFLEVNQRWLTMLGYESPEIIGHVVDGFFADKPERIKGMLDDVMRRGSLPVELYRNRHKNGSIVEVERSQAMIQYSGKNVLMLVDRDVSDQRRLQSQLSRDLLLAADVQRGLLPSGFENSLLRVETIYEPFHVVSGDFYDYAWDYHHNRFYGFVLDVVGHGVASSLQTLAVNVLYRQIAESSMSLTDKLCWMNQHMLRYFPEDTYAAALMFEFDLKKHTLRYATAGIYAFLAAAAALPVWNASPGSLLGIDVTPEYQEHCVPVQRGDAFYFFSDGILDLLPEPHTMRMTDFTGSVAEITRLMTLNRKRDDCSAVCVQIKGDLHFPLYFLVTRLEDHVETRRRIHQFLQWISGASDTVLCVALGEAITNGLQHGTKVWVRMNVIGKRLLMRVRDNGPGFAGNDLVARHAARESAYHFEEHLFEECGRGIPIMMAWTDRVLYNRQGTEVLMVKILDRDKDVPDYMEKGV